MIGFCTSHRQVVPDLLGTEEAVEQEDAARLAYLSISNVSRKLKLVAGHEVGLVGSIRYGARIGCGPKRRCEIVTVPDFFES